MAPHTQAEDDQGRVGSITQTPGGLRRLRYPTPDGKRRDGGRYRTRAEAEDARAKLRTSILGGT